MQLLQKRWKLALLLILAVFLVGGVWTYYTQVTSRQFPVSREDSIASWSFKGAYTGNETLVSQANTDIARLRSLLGTGKFDDYDLYIGIGNDENLEGNGMAAYENYNNAAAIHPSKGLAYANLAHLMDELRAYHTAADAYAKAVASEPGQLEYHLERLSYLTRQFPNDSNVLLAAFADASTQFGDTAPVLIIKAEWLTGLGRNTDAIAAWERVKHLSTGKDVSAIDALIARLNTNK